MAGGGNHDKKVGMVLCSGSRGCGFVGSAVIHKYTGNGSWKSMLIGKGKLVWIDSRRRDTDGRL